ncbi:Nin one binding Zn-ribbon like-domain-containing protein [Alternaria rosae]|uniref:Nin one binding Zn-ribbon like-domain-containing protein n=1 Tax=Alternaria rosae TaxID=1187941 RepID=UPI001E8D1769|nr:Nin one binding Zn-ribbon like-domain-containing protein [Alternaria rosae]KAH6882325.1 Nin one binding Zn-ribbon like-domain-containing protein [Alternaria rosae]
MATPTATQQKPIHSLILDTGPLIKNTVSISTIINAAEELWTTPAILSEIRDEATRSRVQTTLIPFLKIRNPQPASYDAVIAFSKKTGDHAVLSRQDLGILALAYEVHCERNGGDWGLREIPKGEIKRRPGDTEQSNEEKSQNGGLSTSTSKRKNRRRAAKAANKTTEDTAEDVTEGVQIDSGSVEPEDIDEGWEQPTGKRAAKARAPKSTKFNFKPAAELDSSPQQAKDSEEQTAQAEVDEEEGGIAVTQEQVEEQIHEQVVAQIQDQVHDQVQDQIHEQLEKQDKGELESQAVEQAEEKIEEQVQEQLQDQLQGQAGEQGQIEQSAAVEVPTTNIHIEQKAELSLEPETSGQQDLPTQQVSSDESKLAQELEDLSISHHATQQPTPPMTDDSAVESDSDGDWITPQNLTEHQAKDGAIQPQIRTTANRQLDVATMTIDFAMQNVLLQMNLQLLSTNMQRIKNVNTKVLRCHACFNIVKQMDKQFCPRCGQATLQRVSCSTNAAGEFKIHLAKNYQYNKRGDKYSIPKPIAGTANTKWSHGQGGGKGGWGRDLILAEDQKEYTRRAEEDKRTRTRDLMDDNYLPGILTGDRGRAGGRVKVGAGKNVNAKKRT